ncbi:putative nucleotide-binding alpha-beta plait domain superfamily, RNA-binding domain superfamily [Helianthus annuus]|nr:putative nucleotide-binding alpha-beta plait domain superfamily, RNA-binding domain superfamily [Helianthus annuus]
MVVSAKVTRYKQSGQSGGYGFIEFVNRAAEERHLQAYNSTLMPNVEQLFRLNWASFGAGERNQDDTPDYTIFVGDLAADVTDDTLLETSYCILFNPSNIVMVLDMIVALLCVVLVHLFRNGGLFGLICVDSKSLST